MSGVATGASPRRELVFEEVYETCFDYVWRCLRGLGVAEAAVEDATHDVFLVVHRRLPEFDPSRGSVRSWLYAIALRVARRQRAVAKRTVGLDAAPDAPDGSTPFEQTEQSRRVALLERALAELDDDKREVFVLAELEQLSCVEIARITRTKLNTVYSRLRAARLHVQAAWKRMQEQAP